MKKLSRFWEIDALRGIAVIMMIGYHVLFDLWFFARIGVNPTIGILRAIGTIIGATFIFLVGVSSILQYYRIGNRHQYMKMALRRGLVIFGYGMLLTAISYVFFPEYTIVFGVLHLIGVSVLLTPAFIDKPVLSVIFAPIVLIIGLIFLQIRTSFNFLFWAGLIPENFTSLDYYPLLPWFGLVLLGAGAGEYLYKGYKRRYRFPEAENLLVSYITLCGRKSLLIYLIHQPVIVGVILAGSTLLG